MHWYYAIEGQQLGPVDDPEFERLVREGIITTRTLVWRNGMPDWQPYAEVFAAAGTVPPSLSTETPSIPHLVPPVAHPRYAGFWIRFVARFLDGLILGIVGVILRVPLFMMLGMRASAGFSPMMGPQIMSGFALTALINTAVAVAYEVYFVSSRGATPGKIAMGIKIVMANGSPVPPSTAAGRYFAQWISAVILAIGYIMAAFDLQKRALHDRICGTRVIHVR